MSETIGILVDQRTLWRALHGHPTHERISLYGEIAEAAGISIVVFSVDKISVKRHRVRGYVPSSEGWRRITAPIPRVIHKRILFRSVAPLKTLYRLRRRGVVFVNPFCMQNKRTMNAILSRDERVRSHVPATQNYSWAAFKRGLHSGQSLILKPVIGSVGRGIFKATPLPERRVSVTGQFTAELSLASARGYLRARIRPDHYLVQECINLARYEGKPFDLRIPVQRDGKGEWVVAGMVAKVALRHSFLTNVGQGGRAMPGVEVLNSAFGPSLALSLQADVERLAIDVAQAVAGTYTYAADLGLDIGVDVDGKPWLIEVNTRDQRITFHQAGLHEVFRQVYANPILYCAYLSQLLEGS